MTAAAVKRTLERLGEGLSNGDVDAITSCWEVPMMVLSDWGAMPVAEMSEITAFFTQALTAYAAQGLTSTRPEIELIEQLSDRLYQATVRWPAYDAQGNERRSEWTHYVLRIGDDGQPRIRVALTLAN